MEASTSFLKTAGVLLSMWLVLFVVGLAMGVIPPRGGWLPGRAAVEAITPDEEAETAEESAEATEEASSDEGAEPTGTPETTEEPAEVAVVSTGDPAPELAPVVSAPAIHLETHAVCPEPSTAPSLAVLNVLGPSVADGGRPEIVVGCGDEWQVLAFGTEPLPLRVARIVAPPASGGLSAFAAAPVSLDFDGDGHADLALPFVRYGAGGATSGGGLYVVRQDGWNVLGEVRALAPIAAAGVVALDVDGRVGDDLVALNQANPFARLPSEGWAFSGGASPRRTAVLRAGTGARAVAAVDVDLDGSMDVAIASSDDGRVDLFFGNGTGVFARRRSFDVPNAAGLEVADLDGDGHPDLLIEGSVPAILIAAPDADLAVLPLTEVGALRSLQAIDTNGDGRAEILGFAPPQLIQLQRTEAGAYEASTVLELADASFGVRRQLFADLDGDGARELVVVGTRAEGEGRSLELLIVPSTERGAMALTAGSPIADSPWVVEVPLPEAQPL